MAILIASSFANTYPSEAKDWRTEMLTLINLQRAQKGIAPLKLCGALNKAAQDYAEYMARQNFISHKGKDGSTVDLRITRAGYEWRKGLNGGYIGENIAAGQPSVTAVMKSWISSSEHFKNLMNRNFVDVGFGRAFAKNADYPTYWVQNFGKGGLCTLKK
jgi:uncharacterized protein YkwD